MPMHDWTKVDAGIFHDFHLAWIFEIKRKLNRALPPEYYALAEQRAGGFEPDVLALSRPNDKPMFHGSVATLPAPKTKLHYRASEETYVRKQNRIAVRHVSGHRVVAIVEIVSPGNKDNAKRFDQFLAKAEEFLHRGVNLMIIDPFPPGRHDPQGVHAAIWEKLTTVTLEAETNAPLMIASYDTDGGWEAFVEPLAVGDPLPEMPIFLDGGAHVMVSLEAAYKEAWDAVPEYWQGVVAGNATAE